MAEAERRGFNWNNARKTLDHWLSIPLIGASVVSILLAAIILPYWWLAVQWAGTVMPTPSVYFTFTTTTFLLALIVIDSVFIARYYQILYQTQLRISTEALKKSEESFRFLIQRAPFPVVISRRSDSTIMMINQQIADLFSVDPIATIGISVKDFFVNQEDRKAILKKIEEFGHLNNFEYNLITGPGKKFWVSLSVTTIQYNGESALFAAFIDISRRKELEEAIRKSEELYRSIVTASPDAIVFSDLQGVMTMVSPAAITMFGGTSPDDFIGQRVLAFIHPEDAPQAQKKMASLLAGQKLQISQYRGLRIDKSNFPYEIHSELTHDDKGNPSGIVYVIRDITLRVEAEESLRENEERFTQIFQELPDPLLILDESGVVQEINQVGENRLQVSREQISGALLSDLAFFPPDDPGDPIRFILQQISGEPLQTRIHLPDGTQRFVILRTRRIMLRREPAILLMIHDIDEIKRAQNALYQANNQINLLNSITRHDILNRVTVVMAYCELLLKDFTDERISTPLSRVLESGNDIRHLINFTREYQDLGVKKPVWQRLDLIFSYSNIQILLKGITLTLPDSLIEIYADPMLEKVVYNLVENSRRHGQTVTRVMVSYHTQGEDLFITYTDNGVGIPKEEKELIFKKGHGKNTGLGLFLIREILNITGITIKETGNSGEGVRFEMTIPSGSFRTVE